MLTRLLDSLQRLSRFAYTLHVFTRSDVATILIPISAFATIASGTYRLDAFVTRFVWVWLHLLQFCVSNQTTNPHEDSANKPWRPIPSGLISVHAARVLRWILLPICLAISVWCHVLSIGIALCLATLAHNELGWDAHWLPRNVLNAVGYASFGIAAAKAGCTDAICAYPARLVLAQTLLSLVILTTIQAQDFKDVHGDILIGRRTLPLMYPRGSRVLMAILLPTWSVLFTYCYADAGRLLPTCTVLLGAATGARFFFQRSEAQDKKTYLYYNVWLLLLHIFPFVNTQSTLWVYLLSLPVIPTLKVSGI